jgi:hypothetical protein
VPDSDEYSFIFSTSDQYALSTDLTNIFLAYSRDIETGITWTCRDPQAVWGRIYLVKPADNTLGIDSVKADIELSAKIKKIVCDAIKQVPQSIE